MDEDIELLLRKKMIELRKKSQLTTLESFECDKGVKHVNTQLFEKLLTKCKIVIADFWAEWCAPCRMLEPIIEEIAEKYTPKIEVVKINVDENPDLASAFNIMGIPTIIVFNRGKEYTRYVGVSPYIISSLENSIKILLS